MLVAPVWLPVPPKGYGGTERVVSALAEELTARGHQVTLFASGGSETSAELVTTVENPVRLDESTSVADDLVHALTAFRQAARFDVIHDHSGLGPALGAMLDGPPVVHTLHGQWTPAAREYFGLVHDRVELVAISCAQAAANASVRYAAVVHNGIDLAAHPFSDDKGDYLAYVGRASPQKGTATAVQVARGAGLPLKMVVKRHERVEFDYWDEVVVPLLGDDVEVFEEPSHKVTSEVMAHARATLFPIDWPEPFGLVMIESLARGTPVIARPFGAVPEVIEHGVSGMICDTVDEMIAAVHRIGDIDPLACRARVVERFSAQAMTDAYEAVYLAVLDRSAAGTGSGRVTPTLTA
jgi:glycosyltransferase involved in cell wall biosynthesis